MGILIDLEDNQFSDISSGKECATEVDLTSEYLKTKNKLTAAKWCVSTSPFEL